MSNVSVDRTLLIQKYRFSAEAQQGSSINIGARLFENRIGLSVAESAFLLGLSSKTICRLIHEGQIRAVKAGSRKFIIPKEELERWLNRKD